MDIVEKKEESWKKRGRHGTIFRLSIFSKKFESKDLFFTKSSFFIRSIESFNYPFSILYE